MTGFDIKTDPLAIARKDLDFEAMAAATPAVKEILLKAQTLAPVSPPTPWKKIAGGGAALGAALALALAPVVPATTVVSVLHVEFSRTFEQAEAQQVVDSTLRSVPEHILVDSNYTAMPGEKPTGMLTMDLTGVNTDVRTLQAGVETAIAGSPVEGLSPGITAEKHSSTQWTSIWNGASEAVGSLAGKDGGRSGSMPSAHIAENILSSEDLIEKGLAETLAEDPYYELEDAHFLTPGAHTPLPRDHFTLETWPYELSVRVANYRNLTASEQAEIMQRSGDYIAGLNLLGHSNWVGSSDRPPVVVSVCDADNRFDPYTSQRLQAWVVQPEADDADYNVQQAFKEGLADVLAGYRYTIDHRRIAAEDGTAAGWYNVNIRVLGKGETQKQGGSASASDSSLSGLASSAGQDW